MSYFREELEGFDMMILWAYLVIRRENNQSSIWIVDGGNA